MTALPPGFVLESGPNPVIDRIVNVESGGNPNARNPRSSATGAGQFIESTWLETLQRARPDLTAGRSRQELLALRNDPNLSRQMTQAYADANGEMLTRSGFQNTPGNTYLAHFAGPQGALNVLRADPNAPVGHILGPQVVQANPFLANMTAADLQAWANRKMGNTAQAAPAQPQAPQQAQMPALPPGFVLEQPNAPQAGPPSQIDQLWGNLDKSVPPVTNARTPLDPEVNRILEREAPNSRTARIEQMVRDPGPMQAASQVLANNPLTAALSKVLPAEAVLQGLTFGFSDEALAYIRSTAGQGAYDEVLAAERERLSRTRNESPVASVAGEVAGAALTAPLSPAINVLRGANIASRAANAATTGAAYGGLYGFGQGENGFQNRAQNAGNTAAFGALVGGVGAPVVEGAVAATRGLNAINPFRGVVNPEAEAIRRIGTAVQRDAPNTPQATRLAADTLENANTQGVPLTVADTGGDVTRALARSAANTSPEARTALNAAADGRFETQNDRISNVVRGIVGGDPNATALRANIQTAARAANEPAYQAAYRNPNAAAIYDNVLEDLTQAPDMQAAIRAAWALGRNRGAVAGVQQPTRNPFTVDQQTGRVTLDDPNWRPSLQFWDHVKRELDSLNTGESRQLSRVLREHLDSIVPEYATARAGAAAAFGAQDAIEAGQRFTMASMPIKDARIAYARLTPAERTAFANGFASDLLDKIAKVGDRRDVINRIFSNADSRQRIQLALGPQGLQRLEAAARVESIMDRLRTAVQGNSTTARQLAELGLAGAAGGYGWGTGDWASAGTILAGLLARRGALKINQQVAQRVGELLSSNDPQVLRQAYEMIGRSQSLTNAVRQIENDISRGFLPNAPQGLLPQNVIPAAAENDQRQR